MFISVHTATNQVNRLYNQLEPGLAALAPLDNLLQTLQSTLNTQLPSLTTQVQAIETVSKDLKTARWPHYRDWICHRLQQTWTRQSQIWTISNWILTNSKQCSEWSLVPWQPKSVSWQQPIPICFLVSWYNALIDYTAERQMRTTGLSSCVLYSRLCWLPSLCESSIGIPIEFAILLQRARKKLD